MNEDAPQKIRAFRREQAEMRAQFVRKVRQDLRRELRFSRRFASAGRRAMTTARPPHEHGIALSLTNQALHDYEAIILLASDGRADQCLMLWRPMFEKMLVASWSLLHPELATRCFKDQHRHTVLMANRTAREMPELTQGQIPFPEAEAGEEEALNRLFGRYGEKGVTGLRVHELVEDVAGMFDESDARDLRRRHRTVYARSNQVLHATSHAFGSVHAPALEDPAGEPYASMDGRHVLGYALWTLGCMLHAVSDTFDPDCWASLVDLESEGAELFNRTIGEHMARFNQAVAGRLDIDRYIEYAVENRARFADTAIDEACPCGSGKTYGECHHAIDSAVAQFANWPKLGDGILLRAPDFGEGD